MQRRGPHSSELLSETSLDPPERPDSNRAPVITSATHMPLAKSRTVRPVSLTVQTTSLCQAHPGADGSERSFVRNPDMVPASLASICLSLRCLAVLALSERS